MPVVPTHPLPTADEDVLQWVIPAGHLPCRGVVVHAPSLLQTLLDEHVLDAVIVRTGSVLTVLGPGHQWSEVGTRVRSALVDALGAPSRWQAHNPLLPHAGHGDDSSDDTHFLRSDCDRFTLTPGSFGGLTHDEILLDEARQLTTGSLGAFIRSHGGHIDVLGCEQGVVSIALRGHCTDCPAAMVTMKVRFERQLRRRCPWLVDVIRVNSPQPSPSNPD